MATTVNIYEAKTKLSKLVDEAAQGEDVIIARNGKPVARLTPLKPEKLPARFGLRQRARFGSRTILTRHCQIRFLRGLKEDRAQEEGSFRWQQP